MKIFRSIGVTERILYLLMLFTLTVPLFAQSNIENSSKGEHVAIPMIFKSTAYQQEHVLMHYWDHLSSVALRVSSELHEKLFVDYINLFNGMPNKVVEGSLRKMTDLYLHDSLMLKQVLEISEKYFYHPNSPIRNEEWYIPVIETVLRSSDISSVQKIRLNYLLHLMNKNRINTVATNFNMTLANRSEFDLYDIESEYIILYFSNPDCQACIETTNEMTQSELMNILIHKNTNQKSMLKVVNIYTDEDIDSWLTKEPHLPKSWINAYDRQCTINKEELYDLKAIPTLYLLDKDKRVILKDVTFKIIEMYLESKNQSR